MIKSARNKFLGGFIQHQRNGAGFTLIELLIVIAILGILAAAVLVAINPAKRTRQAQDAQRKNDIGSLATELQGFYTTPGAGCYPTAVAVLQTQGYLKQVPTQPGGIAYDFVTSGAGTGCPAESGPTDVAVYATLAEPNTGTRTTTVWCWRSSQGTASEVTAGSSACEAP